MPVIFSGVIRRYPALVIQLPFPKSFGAVSGRLNQTARF
jgi:hypothetical protein